MAKYIQSCFNNRVRTGAIVNLSIKDPIIFFKKAFKSFTRKVKDGLKKSLLKVNVVFHANFIKLQTGDTDIKHFQTKNRVIIHEYRLKKQGTNDCEILK